MSQQSDLEALSLAERHFGTNGADVQFDPHVQDTFGGERIVHGQQQYRGLSIFPHSFVVTIGEDASVTRDGDPLVDPEGARVIPELRVEDAVLAAFRHVREGSRGDGVCHAAHEPLFRTARYRPRVTVAFPMPNRPTVLTRGPFYEPVEANLVLFRDASPPALAWLVTLAAERVADFTIVVAADGDDQGTVLYCAAEAASARCSADVYLFNPNEAGRVTVPFPRAVADYPPIEPALTVRDWVEKDALTGNNIEILFDNLNPKLRAIGGVFTTVVGSNEEQAVNAFYLCNWLHDFFSLIGFGEKDGNFQNTNFTHEGRDGDRLLVNVVPGTHGNANMRAQNDGKHAELTLGVWSQGNPTALDADVVIHEFAHGVSQRLVGGRLKQKALNEAQSLAIGEAWSDYFAVTIQNYYRRAAQANPRYTFAAYASRVANGVRPTQQASVPYDQFNPAAVHFGLLGRAPFTEQHAAGSIFAAALIRMHDALRARHGDGAGDVRGWKLVTDSMRKVKANPTFLEARDALLAVIPAAEKAGLEPIVRDAFARFGMGRNASCKDTKFTNIQAGFTA